MTGFEGVLFDGMRALGSPVRIEAYGDLVLIATPVEAPRSIARDQIRADAPIPCRTSATAARRRAHRNPAYDAVAALWRREDIIARAAFAIESRWWAAVTGSRLPPSPCG
jgi:hypothetical protein